MEVLDATATAAVLPWEDLTQELIRAAHRLADGAICAPERAVLEIPGGRYLVMPAADDRVAITKLVTVHTGNPAAQRPAIQGIVSIADATTGEPLLLLDGPTVTARRTAAVSLVGMRALHRGPIVGVAIVGAGVQAQAHAIAVHEALGANVRIVSRTRSNADAACAALQRAGVSAAPSNDLAAAIEGAQVVVTATTSRVPVLPDELPGDVLVVAVGAFTPEMAEVAPAMIHHRHLVVDTLDGARHEAGDLIQARVSWPRVHSLKVTLDDPHRPQHDVVFKTVGHAAWDLAAATVALASLGR